MDIPKEETKKSFMTKTAEIVSGHPYIVMIVILILVITIIIIYFTGWKLPFANKKNRSKKTSVVEKTQDDTENKLDEIIDELNDKQDKT